MIEWSKLASWKGNRYRSFEELCYQVAKVLYADAGRFTPVDDSGGGDGVEFYLTLDDGDEWGWQAKFYYPQPRLAVGNRKRAIRESLTRACERHPRLTKWILCTPTNFTPAETSWFETVLHKVVPQDMDVELLHWADSDLGSWLSEPRFAGKRQYFFGELELTLEWLHNLLVKQMGIIGDKFTPALHTETSVESRIHALLGDEDFATFMMHRMTQLDSLVQEYVDAVANLESPGLRQLDWGTAKADVAAAAKSLQDTFGIAAARLGQACELLSDQRFDEIRGLDWEPVFGAIEQGWNAYREAESGFDASQLTYAGEDEDKDRVLREAEEIVRRPTWVAADVRGVVGDLISELDSIKQPDLHIFGDAGVGKTHMVGHICHSRLEGGLPALMVLGRQFTSDRPLPEQLLAILDISRNYSWNDFLQALEAAAEAYDTRIPLMIDGLNEATVSGVLSNVWGIGLPALVQEIAQAKNVVLVTTCRTTYRNAVWPDGISQNAVEAYGFGYRVEEAVDKYFAYYKVKADLAGVPLAQFEHPIYLKIFCETQNPTREEEKHIYIGEHTLFEVFDNYLAQVNQAMCNRLGLRPTVRVVIPALRKMAEFLWEERCRSIPLHALTALVDDQPLDRLVWDSSKTAALVDEGPLVCRDWADEGEVVYFTHDLLGGYLIAGYIVERESSDIEAFLQCQETEDRLFSEDHGLLHPLSSDISRSLAALLPLEIGQCLHELSDHPIARGFAVQALFEIPPDHIDERCVALVVDLFKRPELRKWLFELATSTVGHVGHPLNASFWSERLGDLSMAQRDIAWTEHVRESVDQFERLLAGFEASCQSTEPMSEKMKARLRLLSDHIMWVLTSTVRPLRDKATRALYWYGRRLPEEFFDLVLESLEISDPYVSERMLAATYGVAMARQHDFHSPDFAETALPVYGRRLYEEIFKPDAPHATTHILARDYAGRTIEISLVHNPDLLSAEERARIRPPFRDGGTLDWGESDDLNKGAYRDGNAPVHMDFGNYTLGRLVEGRRNYDFDHEGYRTVRANLFWRIYQLGYSLETFGEIDRWIARDNLQYS
ncbi:MAG: hypothetical protein WBB22_17655, partial [Anaerolineae bacterium]